MPVRKFLPIAVVLLAAWSTRCAKTPAAPTGKITVTETTSTTTSIPLADVSAGAVGAFPPGVGIAAATIYNFQFVTPPSGGVPPYTIAWNFGDGAEGAGTAPSHAYMATGDFTATATVTDTKGMTAQALVAVVVRSVTGRWIASFQGAGPANPEGINLIQNQTAVAASVTDDTNAFGLGTGAGSVSNPRSLAVGVTFAAPTMPTVPFAATLVGRLDDTLTTWTGTATGYANCPCGFTATRPASEVNALSVGFVASPPARVSMPGRAQPAAVAPRNRF
jgi:hypothetical protein